MFKAIASVLGTAVHQWFEDQARKAMTREPTPVDNGYGLNRPLNRHERRAAAALASRKRLPGRRRY